MRRKEATLLDFFDPLTNFIKDLVIASGYPGVFFAAFLENFFPPIPSELIFPFVGFIAATGKLDLLSVVFVGTIGAVAGSLFWYGLGYLLGRANLKDLIDRWGIYLRVHFRDVEKAEALFERWERPAVFFGRLIPLVRTFISIPAGFAQMPLGWFITLSFAGTFLWIGVLTAGGYLLGESWESIVPFFENYNLALEIFLIALVVFLFVRFYLQHGRRSNQR